MDYFYLIDLAGTLVFAISGANAAADAHSGEDKIDVFGAAVIAFVTAVGGGTIRDVLIGSHPVGWMKDVNYLYVIGAGVMISFFLKRHILKLTKTMFLFDSIGIGLFTLLGLEKTLDMGISPAVAVLMGAVSASFGGVVRDVLVNRIPLIFRSEIYATACIAGGVLFLILKEFEMDQALATSLCIVFVIALRMLAVKFHLTLPKVS